MPYRFTLLVNCPYSQKATPRTVRYEAVESPKRNRYEARQIRRTSATAVFLITSTFHIATHYRNAFKIVMSSYKPMSSPPSEGLSLNSANI